MATRTTKSTSASKSKSTSKTASKTTKSSGTTRRKGGLGKKGLNQLLSVNEEETEVVETKIKETEMMDVNKIGPNAKQPRKKFNEEKLDELAESIKNIGIIEPIIVTKVKDDFYEIVAGERRWRAAKKAGVSEVPVVVKEFTNQEIMEIALIENVQREDLNPIEEAEAYNSLIKEYKLTQEQVALKVSKSRAVITNSLRLLKLDKRVREMLMNEELSNGHARALLGLKENKDQYKFACKVVEKQLSVRETEKIIKDYLNKDKSKEKKNTKSNDGSVNTLIYRDYENKIKTAVGTKVAIKEKENGKGKIEIDFYNNDDFERIMEILLKEK